MNAWRPGWMHRAYSALFNLYAPFDRLRLAWRARAEPLYRQAIGERYGRYATGSATPRASDAVWVHAVSLGETRAAAALIAALREANPGIRFVLTHATATGRSAGAELLQEGDAQAWVPHDTPTAVARFFVHFRPAVGVLMETEVWPNLVLHAARAGVPMVLANARLSERSLAGAVRVAALLRPAYASFDRVLAQTEADAERLVRAGARRVDVLGNLKFDIAPDPALVARGRAWRAALGRDVLLAAVTREGEEAMLLAAYRKRFAPAAQGTASASAPASIGAATEPPAGRRSEGSAERPLLVIVPRHPQRFDGVAQEVRTAGYTLARRSRWNGAPPADALGADVWLGDSMREMPLYYGLADVALLGGSFAPLGGQNLIEAAACGCPVVMGPHTFNFAEAAAGAEAAGAALRVATIEDGVTAGLRLIDDGAERRMRGDAGIAFAERHRGAARRMADAVAAYLPERR